MSSEVWIVIVTDIKTMVTNVSQDCYTTRELAIDFILHRVDVLYQAPYSRYTWVGTDNMYTTKSLSIKV
jgi:hypothetical protein